MSLRKPDPFSKNRWLIIESHVRLYRQFCIYLDPFRLQADPGLQLVEKYELSIALLKFRLLAEQPKAELRNQPPTQFG